MGAVLEAAATGLPNENGGVSPTAVLEPPMSGVMEPATGG